MTRDEDERRQADVLGQQLVEQRIAGDVRQADIADDERVVLFAQCGESRRAAAVPVAAEALQAEAVGQRFAHDLVVFNQADLAALSSWAGPKE